MASPVTIESSKRAAPYVAFRTFLNSLDALSQGVPPKIDKTIWRTQSGVNQGLIMNTYRFFGLVDDDDLATEELRQLVQHPERRPEILRSLIEIQYEELLAGHDLTKMTPKMLEDAFDVFAVTGTTKRKAVTFFLQAAKYSDIAMSSFLTSQIRNTSGRRRRNKIKEIGLSIEEQMPPMVESVTGQHGSIKKLPLKSGGTLILVIGVDVFSISPEDRDFVFGLIDKFQEYEKGSKNDVT